MDYLPTYSIDLIKELDKLYPPTYPLLTDTEREIWFKAGKRSLIETLINLIEEDSNTQISNVL